MFRVANKVELESVLERIDACIAALFSQVSIGRLHALVDEPPELSLPGTRALFRSFANYVHQLHDGVIDPSTSTKPIFVEFAELLRAGETRELPMRFEQRLADLDERIDIEASGGFDAAEAGELGTFSPVTATEGQRNGAYRAGMRLRASLDSLQRLHADGPAFAHVLATQSELLAALLEELPAEPMTPLQTFAEQLALLLGQSKWAVSMPDDGSINASIADEIASLAVEIALALGSERNGSVSMRASDAELRIEFSSDAMAFTPETLRRSAIERELLTVRAQLSDSEALQFALLPDSEFDADSLMAQSMLFASLEYLGAQLTIEKEDEFARFVLCVPQSNRLTSVAVFETNNASYAVLTSDVKSCEPRLADAEANESFDDSRYPVAFRNAVKDGEGYCVTLQDAHGEVQWHVNATEVEGLALVGTCDTPSVLLGGCTRLLDRRVVTLLTVADVRSPIFDAVAINGSTNPRLLAFTGCELPTQLRRQDVVVDWVNNETEAIAEMQECQPHVALLNKTHLKRAARFLLEARKREVHALVETSVGDQEPSESAELKTVQTSRELLTELRASIERDREDR